jgi:hypothetical protein
MSIEEANFFYILFQEGLDLFNEEKYFEAHEAWEELWKKLGSLNLETVKTFIQAFIHTAAHFIHIKKGNYYPAIYQANAALKKFLVQNQITNERLKSNQTLIALKDLDISPIKFALEYNTNLIINTQKITEEQIAFILENLLEEKENFSNSLSLKEKLENLKKNEKINEDLFVYPKIL